MYIADHVACEAARERAISDQGTDCQDMRIARDGFVNERAQQFQGQQSM